MEEWVCTVNDLGFHYKRGGRAVLKGLSLSLHKGEILGIRGENGAGKSTLLKAIAGILPYDKGEVLIPKEIKKNLSYLPQDLSLYESLSALENLYFYGKILGLPAKVIFTRAHWLLKELGLEDKERERVSALSGGMKRRVQGRQRRTDAAPGHPPVTSGRSGAHPSTRQTATIRSRSSRRPRMKAGSHG